MGRQREREREREREYFHKISPVIDDVVDWGKIEFSLCDGMY